MAENTFTDASPFTLPGYLTRQGEFEGIPEYKPVPDKYPMSHPRRGVALIFNHEVFNDPTLKPRTGTESDVAALRESIVNLGFELRIRNNNTKAETLIALDKAAAEDHSDADCLVVVVLSHGSENRLYAKDKYYNVDDLWSPFTTCPTLVGKPKLFFLQACRGADIDAGIGVDPASQTGVDAGGDHDYMIPTMADVMVMYSTVDGYVSYRERWGTPFIQALCKELNEKTPTNHLEDIMLYVRKNVAFNYLTRHATDRRVNSKKQVPQISSTLTRFVFFRN